MTGRHYLDRFFPCPSLIFFINDYTLLYFSYKFSCGFLPKIFFIFLRIAIFPAVIRNYRSVYRPRTGHWI